MHKYLYLFHQLTLRQILSGIYSSSHLFLRRLGFFTKNTSGPLRQFSNYLTPEFKQSSLHSSIKQILLDRFIQSTNSRISKEQLSLFKMEMTTRSPTESRSIINDAELICKNSFELWQEDNITFEKEVSWVTTMAVSKEWQHSLNRFYFLKTLGQAFILSNDEKFIQKGLQLIEDWIVKAPYGHPVTWQSMNISERIMNWIWFLTVIVTSSSIDKNIFFNIYKSVYYQTLFLSRHLEYRANNNHLLFNARTLIYVALTLTELKKSQKWLKNGLKLFTSEIYRQTLADGFNIESCSGYHLWVTQLLFETVLFMDRHKVHYDSKLKSYLEKMLDALLHLVRPDMSIPQLGDFKDPDVFITPEELFLLSSHYFQRKDHFRLTKQVSANLTLLLDKEDYQRLFSMDSADPETNVMAFTEVGYYLYRSNWSPQADYLCIDGGPISCLRNNPGHGHADALSFELVVNGHPIIIDPGTFTYDDRIERQYFRSTASHNTVVVNGENQSEIWSAFRIARKAKTTVHNWRVANNWLYFCGSHDGYKRHANPVIHKRHLFIAKNQYFIIFDELHGSQNQPIVQYFHLDHEVQISNTNGQSIEIVRPIRMKFISFGQKPIKVAVEKAGKRGFAGWVSPNYHVKIKSTTLTFESTLKENPIMGLLIFQEKRHVSKILINKIENPPNTVKKLLENKKDITYYRLKSNLFTDFFAFSNQKREVSFAFFRLSNKNVLLENDIFIN